MSELEAAAARQRKGCDHACCPDGWQDCNDARAVSDAALALGLFREGDQLPVTSDWFLSMREKSPWLGCSRTGDHWWVAIDTRTNTPTGAVCGHVWIKAETRGDVRAAMASFRLGATE